MAKRCIPVSPPLPPPSSLQSAAAWDTTFQVAGDLSPWNWNAGGQSPPHETGEDWPSADRSCKTPEKTTRHPGLLAVGLESGSLIPRLSPVFLKSKLAPGSNRKGKPGRGLPQSVKKMKPTGRSGGVEASALLPTLFSPHLVDIINLRKVPLDFCNDNIVTVPCLWLPMQRRFRVVRSERSARPSTTRQSIGKDISNLILWMAANQFTPDTRVKTQSDKVIIWPSKKNRNIRSQSR